jgi:hypothetical protein
LETGAAGAEVSGAVSRAMIISCARVCPAKATLQSNPMKTLFRMKSASFTANWKRWQVRILKA